MKNKIEELAEVLLYIIQICETQAFIENEGTLEEAIEQACDGMNYNINIIRGVTGALADNFELSDIDL